MKKNTKFFVLISILFLSMFVSACNDDNHPRIMYWWGKVNQHWDVDEKVWKTDPDGISGANLDKLEYCQKFYPETKQVVEYKEETTSTWRNRGNVDGPFTSTKMSYLCIK